MRHRRMPGASRRITIGGETFRLVAITESLTPQSAAWRYRVDVQDYLSAYRILEAVGGGRDRQAGGWSVL